MTRSMSTFSDSISSISRQANTRLTRRQESVLPREMYRYQLSTVVTHEGKLDNGHYWANVKSGCEWFHCDDEKGAFRRG